MTITTRFYQLYTKKELIYVHKIRTRHNYVIYNNTIFRSVTNIDLGPELYNYI